MWILGCVLHLVGTAEEGDNTPQSNKREKNSCGSSSTPSSTDLKACSVPPKKLITTDQSDGQADSVKDLLCFKHWQQKVYLALVILN